jgi:hypothetical protein
MVGLTRSVLIDENTTARYTYTKRSFDKLQLIGFSQRTTENALLLVSNTVNLGSRC